MRIPNHIAIIPDGNRRWATNNNLPKYEGYAHGLKPGLSLLREAKIIGVKEITYYGFTTDNCTRPPAQLEAFSKACENAVELIAAEGVSLLIVGDSTSPHFPKSLLPYTTRKDVAGGGIRVNFLVNYGWEWDLSAIQGQTTRTALLEAVHSRDISRVDLVIRWGNMRRLSGLLPLQTAYADFFVVDTLWPDYQPEQFLNALEWYDKQDITLGG